MKNNLFYCKCNTKEEIAEYERFLSMMGSLSNLFSTNEKPFIDSRVAENLFCRCLNAENLSRNDITADAKKNNIGIGIKTWINSDLQKIAEFDKDVSIYKGLSTENKIMKIAQLRNDRIDFTLRTQNLNKMVYHCIKREVGKIQIYECPLDKININKIKNISTNDKSIKFEDDINKYSFQLSKSTLYKYFDDLILNDTIKVQIIPDPYQLLDELLSKKESYSSEHLIAQIFLPLYSYSQTKGKVVEEKSGLNLRFASGRKRNIYEVYIPIPAQFRKKHRDFFPDKKESFDVLLPNGKSISLKVCQENDKALMSNPNEELGKWLIDDVLKIDPKKKIKYSMLEKFGIDSVVLQKRLNFKTGNRYYTMNFAKTGSYEEFMGNIDLIND